ncbi:DNA phosphorothioation-dependent restriction protein DptG [Viridibacillus arvi]|uniref:DNA phosphorothioation-dependent restriction protein DptG n=1 Tax=Viridibacillus arvi TaxID=263475 RepID=UPI003D06E859
MEYTLDFDRIKGFVTDKNDKYSFERRKYVRVLPLPSRTTGDRAEYKDGFSTVSAALLRLIEGESLEFTQQADFYEDIIDAGEFDTEETKAIFKEFLQVELGQADRNHVNTIQNIKYIAQPEAIAERKGQTQIIEFFYDVFIRHQHEEIKDIVSCLQSKGLMQDILNVQVKKSRVTLRPKYRVLFKAYSDTFKKDLMALVKSPGFFIENIDELFIHYTFIAMTQIILQTNKFSQFDEINLHTVPFMLNTEKASTWRIGYKEGFQRLKEQVESFYTHEHILNILALNTFTSDENLYYHDYAEILEKAGKDATNSYIASIYKWVNTVYCRYLSLEPKAQYEGQDLDTAYRYMFEMVRKGVPKEHFSRFPLMYTIFITRFYRKNGGSLGTILALNLKQLLLFTAVSVGTKSRIELNELWQELEKRGIALDDDTKMNVVVMLDKLNYIDKKSDSGDAQYVKSIL